MTPKSPDLILTGIQGSGKGTQAKILEQAHGYLRFETGGALRAIAQSDSALGKRVKATIDAGDLVANETIMEIVEDWMENQDLSKPIIFDGVPRFEEQRVTLEALLEKFNRSFLVISIELAEGEVFRRLAERAEIEGRADDNPESIKKRISLFHEETKPLLDKWRERELVRTVNGENSIEVVTLGICALLGLDLDGEEDLQS